MWPETTRNEHKRGDCSGKRCDLRIGVTNSGEYLYFVAGGPNFVKGDPTNLYRVSMLGGLATKIIDNLEGNFAISSSDRQIAFIRQSISPDGMRQYSLTIANSDGSNERVLLVRAHPDDLDVPVWSPDDEIQ